MQIILLEGEDIYLKLKKINEIKLKQEDLKSGINYFKYQKIEAEDLIYQIEMPSFLGGDKLIILEDETFFKTSEKNNKTLIDFLSENAEDKNINVTLLCVYDQKLRDTNKLKKIFMQYGRIYNISKPNDTEIRKEIINILKHENMQMDYKLIMYFIESVGKDLYKIVNELDKVIRYVKQKSKEKSKDTKIQNINISKEDIDKVIIKTEDAKMFEITKALEINQNQKALKIFKENFSNKTEILGFVSYLYSYYFEIYLTKLAQENGVSPDSVLNLPQNRKFVANIYRRLANRFETEKLKYILKELSRIDMLTKSENTDTYMLLKSLIIYI